MFWRGQEWVILANFHKWKWRWGLIWGHKRHNYNTDNQHVILAAKAKEDATDSTAITAIITTATLRNMRNKTTREETTKTGDLTAYSDILEGRIFFGPRNARFFIFSDFLLTILHALYLVSNKVASNGAKITIFLHILYSWIADPQDAHEKLICRRTRRATTLLRPPLESSRRGESRSDRTIFV